MMLGLWQNNLTLLIKNNFDDFDDDKEKLIY